MEQLFTSLTHGVEGTAWVALGAAFLWGILSIVLSPCHLASIPLIVGFISNQGQIRTRQAFAISSLFATGILAAIALIGALTAAAGRMMGDVGAYGNYVVAVVFFAVGLHLLGVLPVPLRGPAQVGMRSKGLLAALVLGLVFGVALGPCTFAYMAPVLAVCFKLGSANPLYAISLLLAYGVGHCAVIVAAGTSAKAVQGYLSWAAESKVTTITNVVCGVLVLGGGLYLLYTAR